MSNHFYAVYDSYHPNTAATNRMLSYLRAWAEMDVKVTVVFMLPDRDFSRLKKMGSNITMLYMWDSFPVRNYLLYNLLFPFFVAKLVRMLGTGDNVYIYSNGYVLSRLVRRQDINLFLEKTENPLVSNPGHWPYKIPIKRYLTLCNQIKGLFVISKPLKVYFSENGVAEEKIHIVNMTVDASRFEGIEKSVGQKYIAYCGTATNNKDGVDKLIQSFSVISPNHPDLFLYIIGKAPDMNRPGNNAQLAEELGIKDKVVFTGIIPYSEIPQMLTDAVMLALNRPDNLQAKCGFPTKLGEYLLTGNPVVVTSVGDIPLFLKDRISGMVASPNSNEDFANKMEWLLNHPKEAAAIGQKGRKVALVCFNNRIEAKKILDVIFSNT